MHPISHPTHAKVTGSTRSPENAQGAELWAAHRGRHSFPRPLQEEPGTPQATPQSHQRCHMQSIMQCLTANGTGCTANMALASVLLSNGGAWQNGKVTTLPYTEPWLDKAVLSSPPWQHQSRASHHFPLCATRTWITLPTPVSCTQQTHNLSLPA